MKLLVGEGFPCLQGTLLMQQGHVRDHPTFPRATGFPAEARASVSASSPRGGPLPLSLCVISLGDEPSAAAGSCEPMDEVVMGRVLYTQAVRIATNRAKEAGGGYGVREFVTRLVLASVCYRGDVADQCGPLGGDRAGAHEAGRRAPQRRLYARAGEER